MWKFIEMLSDICVIVFDLMLYTQMTIFRKNEKITRRISYAGCSVIVAFYILAVYVLNWPVSISSFVCMTLPSLALFWTLCKYRDARFFLTFCFVDTVSLILGFIARYIGVLLGKTGIILSVIIMLSAFILLYRAAKPYIKRYREALEFMDSGWKSITFSAAIIYIALIFIAAYPKPLIERQEYALSYLMVGIMVLSFYAVFFANIMMTKKVYDQSVRLKEQRKWFKMAYVDALTDIPNRMAYMERIHEVERTKDSAESTAIVVIDLDHFKNINDTFGHSTGDEVLKQTAKCLSDNFSDGKSMVYRIGGDEFVVIAVGVGEVELLRQLKAFGKFSNNDLQYSISYGYSFVDMSEENAVDKAFSRADAMMYTNKTQKTAI